MSTIDLISAALVNPSTPAITLYWDKQDADNVGPAYRTADDSGGLELLRWAATDGRNHDVIHTGLGSERIPLGEGMHLEDFFRGPDGAYLGPDSDGVYPVLIAA